MSESNTYMKLLRKFRNIQPNKLTKMYKTGELFRIILESDSWCNSNHRFPHLMYQEHEYDSVQAVMMMIREAMTEANGLDGYWEVRGFNELGPDYDFFNYRFVHNMAYGVGDDTWFQNIYNKFMLQELEEEDLMVFFNDRLRSIPTW